MKNFTRSITALLLLLWLIPCSANAVQTLIPGGQIIGLELGDNSVTVADFDTASAAKDAGMKTGDKITHIDHTAVTSAVDIRKALDRSDGTVEIRFIRNGQTRDLTVKPAITAGGPRLGIYLKDSISGVGTVTWFDPDTNTFGALGHSVNEAGGSALPMTHGDVYAARILSVKKGKTGQPGQLLGTLDPNRPLGTLYRNCSQGVFGKLTEPIRTEALPIAEADGIKTGPAVIRSTITGDQVQEYSVEILKIYAADRKNGRNLLLKVTDPVLLEATGGIVQGMSGSPIIQDGKLIGAVTHVLVNDPTTGYGIFIENMLDAAA